MQETILTTESIAGFRQWLSERGRSENTIRSYCADVKMFFAESKLGSLPASSLPLKVTDWLRATKTTNRPRTSSRRLASLREFAQWAGYREKILPDFKMPRVGQAFPHPLPNPARDIQSLLDACETIEQRALVAMLGLEGMRMHEALATCVGQFDLTEMTLDVWGKGCKQRTIPITERAWDYLAPSIIETQLGSRESLVCYSDRGARYFITALGEKAGISRPISSHDLRANFATLAYDATKDILLVQAWLGHADVTTTQGYVGLSMEAMRRGGSF